MSRSIPGMWAACTVVVTAVVISGCGSLGFLAKSEPDSGGDQKANDNNVISMISAASPGEQIHHEGKIFMVSSPYSAASGLTCKPYEVTPTSSHAYTRKIICSKDNTWFAAPDIN